MSTHFPWISRASRAKPSTKTCAGRSRIWRPCWPISIPMQWANATMRLRLRDQLSGREDRPRRLDGRAPRRGASAIWDSPRGPAHPQRRGALVRPPRPSRRARHPGHREGRDREIRLSFTAACRLPAAQTVELSTKGGSLAPRAGLEPATRCLEGSRSIQLSYRGTAGKVPEKRRVAFPSESNCRAAPLFPAPARSWIIPG